jgi:hypothetical protein
MITEDSKKVITAISKVKDFNELTPANLKIFTKAVVAVNDFNKKMSKYGEAIFNKHLKTLKEWREYLSESDWERIGLDKVKDYEAYVRCFKSGAMTKYWGRGGWSMGDSTEVKTKYEFSNDGKVLIVINSWKTKEARFSHVPWIPRERRFIITLSNGNVDVEGDHIDKQR